MAAPCTSRHGYTSGLLALSRLCCLARLQHCVFVMRQSLWSIINATLTYTPEVDAWKLTFNYQDSGTRDQIHLRKRDVREAELITPVNELTNNQLGHVIGHMCWDNYIWALKGNITIIREGQADEMLRLCNGAVSFVPHADHDLSPNEPKP